MIYIFEGADRVGKTTLALAWARKLYCPYFHSTWAKNMDQGILEYLQEQKNVIMQNASIHQNVVVDRLWLSEHVYGNTLRARKYPFNFWDSYRTFEYEHDVTYIQVCRNKKAAADSQTLEGGHGYTREQYLAVVEAYDLAFSELLYYSETRPRIVRILTPELGDRLASCAQNILLKARL